MSNAQVCDYFVDMFMKIILDVFTIYNDVKITYWSQCAYVLRNARSMACHNLDKYALMVFLSIILSFNVSKEGELLNPKKVQAIVNILVPTTPQQI